LKLATNAHLTYEWNNTYISPRKQASVRNYYWNLAIEVLRFNPLLDYIGHNN